MALAYKTGYMHQGIATAEKASCSQWIIQNLIKQFNMSEVTGPVWRNIQHTMRGERWWLLNFVKGKQENKNTR